MKSSEKWNWIYQIFAGPTQYKFRRDPPVCTYLNIPDHGDGPSKIAAKLETLRYFKFVVEYCDKNPEAQELFQSELVICRELVQLLPVKIRKMQAEYNSGNHNR